MFDSPKAGKVYCYEPTRQVKMVTFPGVGVLVTYLPTGAKASWLWKDREKLLSGQPNAVTTCAILATDDRQLNRWRDYDE